MKVKNELREILVCPACKGRLIGDSRASELICPVDRLAFPIEDGIPRMIAEDARQLPADEEITA
ncbi:MAG: Trm112 family protein [Pseudomonadota bacterium]